MKMKNHSKLMLMMLIALVGMFSSCTGQKSVQEAESENAGTKVFCFKDSCQHLVVSLSLELPMGKDSASTQIRDSLIADFVESVQSPGYDDGDIGVKPYAGDKNDLQALVDYYGKADYEYLLQYAKSDYEDRMQYLEEDTTMDEEAKQFIMEDVPQWEYDLEVKQLSDTLGVVVYYSQAYIYCGGAHGGVGGTGALTFDKETGTKVNSFVTSDASKALQPLIRKGLRQYYAECGDTLSDKELTERLMIDDPMILLPQGPEYPNATADSIIFTYGQYEIAPYADGMPSFKLSVKDLEPYLTPEGKALLEKARLTK